MLCFGRSQWCYPGTLQLYPFAVVWQASALLEIQSGTDTGVQPAHRGSRFKTREFV